MLRKIKGDSIGPNNKLPVHRYPLKIFLYGIYGAGFFKLTAHKVPRHWYTGSTSVSFSAIWQRSLGVWPSVGFYAECFCYNSDVL